MPSINQFIIVFTLLFIGPVGFLNKDVEPIKNTFYFDIIHKDNVIGSLKASKTIKESKVHYQSVTTINTRVIKEIDVNYLYNVTYENNKLKRANVLIDVNDKPYADILTNWEIDYYQVSKNDKNELVVEEDIKYATILLYFDEPINIKRCYSEQDGSFNTIIPLGNHSYKKINAKNNENIYHYKNGFLEKAEINGGVIKFDIVAQK
ncbi:hypothetical protein SAMN04488007_2375 [Maribacter aquivivus]|uniref:Uncharacterized protein n=1 Tax=Maribacter aquivivus TaxID=228958 RepID=A0A1M6QL88_9FLAO|nr:DUF6134 family protein [Maribacter aquivivus]SHK20935.1 hypothetical protein SAMN04488007_2375 [Maribacter aquivivus]